MEIGGRRLEFRLRRSARRTMAISVEPDRRVVVTAPIGAPEDRVAAAVSRRANWIWRQQQAFDGLAPPPPPRQWVAGETHRYLGRQYRLRLRAGSPTSVRLAGAFFEVTVPLLSDGGAVRSAMDLWYREHARSLLSDRVARAMNSTTWLDIPRLPQVRVRVLKRRWGTTRSGGVCFNVELVKLPLGCIDYVVVHELVHLKIPHHGPQFWRLLARCLPQWERWRDRLWRQEI